jgi:phosphatidylserine/phosphatidylglycerophosphate/cardiolipin synthase-like enzyme
MPPESLLEAIRQVAQELPLDAVEALGAALCSCPASDADRLRSVVLRSVCLPDPRTHVVALVDTWQQVAPHLPPEAIRLALVSVAHACHRDQQERSVELVWTGPGSGSSFRRTDQALLQVIQETRRELLVVTFAAYKVPLVARALENAARRGVEIIFVAESSEHSAGKVTFDAVNALGPEVAAVAAIYVWPHDKRPVDSAGRHGSLHAKCAVADDDLLLLSSANLTDFALSLNMEMGLLVRGGCIPRQVIQHYRHLIQTGHLVQLGA